VNDTPVSNAACSGHRLVAPAGDLDLATAPRLRQDLVDASASGSTLVVLDLERVDFLDSVGISVIVGGHRRLRHEGRSLHLAAPQAIVRRVLGLTRLDTLIPTYETVDAAVSSCPSEHTAA
jgi:anti-sigma B factor antagonist